MLPQVAAPKVAVKLSKPSRARQQRLETAGKPSMSSSGTLPEALLAARLQNGPIVIMPRTLRESLRNKSHKTPNQNLQAVVVAQTAEKPAAFVLAAAMSWSGQQRPKINAFYAPGGLVQRARNPSGRWGLRLMWPPTPLAVDRCRGRRGARGRETRVHIAHAHLPPVLSLRRESHRS